MSRTFRVDNEYEGYLEGGVSQLVDNARRDKWLRTEGNARAREIPDFTLKQHPDQDDEVICTVGKASEWPRIIEVMKSVLESSNKATGETKTDGNPSVQQ